MARKLKVHCVLELRPTERPDEFEVFGYAGIVDRIWRVKTNANGPSVQVRGVVQEFLVSKTPPVLLVGPFRLPYADERVGRLMIDFRVHYGDHMIGGLSSLRVAIAKDRDTGSVSGVFINAKGKAKQTLFLYDEAGALVPVG